MAWSSSKRFLWCFWLLYQVSRSKIEWAILCFQVLRFFKERSHLIRRFESCPFFKTANSRSTIRFNQKLYKFCKNFKSILQFDRRAEKKTWNNCLIFRGYFQKSNSKNKRKNWFDGHSCPVQRKSTWRRWKACCLSTIKDFQSLCYHIKRVYSHFFSN